jgi:enoyl-CoA hydratase/carnithine racemase
MREMDMFETARENVQKRKRPPGVQVDKNDQATVVRIEWPGIPGELNNALIFELDQALNYIEDELDSSVIVISGLANGNTGCPPPPELDQCRKWEDLVVRIDRLGAFSMAIIDGACVSASLQLALACDFRLATDRSSIQMPAVRLGYLPGMSTFRLAKYVGLGVAKRLLLTGDQIAAADALSLGLLDSVCPSSELDEAVGQRIAELATIDGKVVKLARRLLNESFSTSFEDAIGNYLAAQHHCLSRLPKKE